MHNRLSTIRTLVASAFFGLMYLSPVSAQINGTGTGTGTGIGIGTGTGTGTGATGQDNFTTPSISGDEAFSRVDRGATVGATSSTGLGFSDVGGAAAAQGGGLGGIGGIGGLGGGGFGGGLGGLSGGQGFGGQSQNPQPVIRTRLRSAVDVSYPTPRAIGQKVSTQFRRLPERAGLGSVNVSLDGSTAIVTGVVATDKQRRMSELLLRLEPGVRRVDNRITVAP